MIASAGQTREELLAEAFGDALHERVEQLTTNLDTRERRQAEAVQRLAKEIDKLNARLDSMATLVANGPPNEPRIRVINEVDPAQVHVTNEVVPGKVEVVSHPNITVVPSSVGLSPEIVVNVDTAPLAALLVNAVTEMRIAVKDALASQQEMLSQLVAVLSEQPPPTINVSPRAPEVNVSLPEPPQREKRSFTLKHGDGTETKVYED